MITRKKIIWILLFTLVSMLLLNNFLMENRVVIPLPDAVDYNLPKPLSTVQCSVLLDCYTHGAWRFKSGLTTETIRRRQAVDKFLLENLDFPGVLHREDNRCGYGFLLPSSRLPALCDEHSNRPCCNEATGVCGNSTEHCACPQCKDFSKYFDAELAEWKPFRSECPFKHFNSEETCALLNSQMSDLVFIGDSLMRHFFNAFSLLITNDPLKGALKRTLSSEEEEQCQGEMQFVDRGKYSCHLKTITEWEQFNHSGICEGKTNFKTFLVEAYYLGQLHLAMEAVGNLLGKRRAVVALGVGMHFALNSTSVIEQYLKPLLALVQSKGSGWPLIIWVNIHQVDNFLVSDCKRNYSPAEKFNREMSKFCRERNIPSFETSRVTRFIKSHDGLHFGGGGNLAKVQVLLNYLKNRFELCEDGVENSEAF